MRSLSNIAIIALKKRSSYFLSCPLDFRTCCLSPETFPLIGFQKVGVIRPIKPDSGYSFKVLLIECKKRYVKKQPDSNCKAVTKASIWIKPTGFYGKLNAVAVI